MIRLKKFVYESKEIFESCTKNITGARKDHILASKDAIVNAGSEYEQLALDLQLVSVAAHSQISGGASKDEMVWLYEKKFVADGGRTYYDKIMLIPPNGICPFCGKRFVSTLDHYLPKSKYPLFAIAPENLVAACSDCNKGKGDAILTDLNSAVIHPYYDNFEDEIWIVAKIIEKFPIGFYFEVISPPQWDKVKLQRAKTHFEVFKLSKLYSSHAVEVFIPYSKQLKRLYLRHGVSAIKEDISDRIEAHRECRKNSLEAAMYESLLNSRWFFDVYMPNEYKEA